MFIQVQYNAKFLSKNKVYLIEKISEVKGLDLTKDESSYFSNELKNDDLVVSNNAGVFTAVILIKELSEHGAKEKLRKNGALIYDQMKKQAKDLTLIGNVSLAIELVSEGISLASYRFEKYLSADRKEKVKLEKVTTSFSKANLNNLNAILEATTWARDLINEPLSFLTAKQLSEEIKKKYENTDVKVTVLGKSKIESLKMGGLLAVNRGSIDPPTFTIIEYKPTKAVNTKPIVLVGKGIVYDTGGLSLKPTANSMDFMKCDMGGAAAVIGATYAAAKLKLPLHIVTLIPATDNRPGENAYVPGDIVTMYDGTTVEVLNTDAEGRMVLADALAYAKKYNPELVIDAATLTGSAVAAVGLNAMVVMGNAKQADFDLLSEAGFATHERTVQFPFWDDYAEEMKSQIADLKNLGGPYAGMITAGKFLEHFTNYPYIHVDLAGPTFLHKRDSYRGQGGTGVGVRLLTEFLNGKVNEWKKRK